MPAPCRGCCCLRIVCGEVPGRIGAVLIGSVLALFLCGAGYAGDAREITWSDLLPKEEKPFHDPFAALTEDQLLDLGLVARIRLLIENDKTSADGPDALEEKGLTAKLAAQGVDVDYLLSQRERVARERRERAEAVDAGVDGQRVRIPGYMLPLESDEAGVTRFLLVPWVGACIHTPPPPPNQMIHVIVPGGTENRGRFAPVWLEGRIELKPASYDLFLVDGTRSVNVAYTMMSDLIERFSSAESDVLRQVEVPPESLEGHGFWQRWQTRVSLLFTKTMTDIRDRHGSGPLIFGLLVAFLYGVVHTLGPGHGKAVVVSYFVGEGGNFGKGVGMGVRIAVFHVLSALVVVLLTDLAVRQVTGHAPSDYRVIRLISYAGIAAIGLWMLVGAIRGLRRGSHRDHAHHHGHDHKHHAGCGCEKLAERTRGPAGFLSLAIGSVPCTGALLVLLFGLANDLLWPSVVMVVAISAGMAMALSAVGCATILGRRVLDRRVGDDSGRRVVMAARMSVAAAAGVFLIGCVLFGLTWANEFPPDPSRSDGFSAAKPPVSG